MKKPKTAIIRINATGELVTVMTYGFVWIDAKGNEYHKSQAKLVKVND